MIKFITTIIIALSALSAQAQQILFQGKDAITYNDICSKDISDIYSSSKSCELRIKEYAGSTLITRDNGTNWLHYSYANYDEQKRITAIHLVFRGFAQSEVMEIITAKYGKPKRLSNMKMGWENRDGSTIYTGYINETSPVMGRSTPAVFEVTIITPAMRKLISEATKKSIEESDKQKANAIKNL